VTPKKLILVVIDGLTPSMLEAAIESGSAPTLARLVEHGVYRRAVSTFPSLTPVCLSSIATGAHPDVHEIPHLVWYCRGERRLVEYGSSFGAVRAAGIGRTLRDTLVNMNAEHLGKRAVTLYRVVERAGKRVAWLALLPLTGRTHQLRAHCAAIGTPILGDGKYGGAGAFLPGEKLARRLHLHARAIELPRPGGGTIRVTAPLPPHMAATWRFFGFDPQTLEESATALDF